MIPSQPLQRSFIKAFNQIAGFAHRNSEAKGFWKILARIRSRPAAEAEELEAIFKLSRVALMHQEAAEASEPMRIAGIPMDKHLPHRSAECVELADLVIRVMDYAAAYGHPLPEVILEKMCFNSYRPLKHGKKV
jgi:hypothetical protein